MIIVFSTVAKKYKVKFYFEGKLIKNFKRLSLWWSIIKGFFNRNYEQILIEFYVDNKRVAEVGIHY